MAMAGLLAGRMLRSAAASRRSMSVVAGLQKHAASQVKQGTLALEIVSSFRHRLRAYSAARRSPGEGGVYKRDMLLTDLSEKDLKGHLASSFGQDYLSEASGAPSFPVYGFLTTLFLRPMVSLVVEWKGKMINVFFIVDSGSPYTCINSATMEALDIEDHVVLPLPLWVHSIQMSVIPTPQASHFREMNVLGTDFLSRRRGLVVMDYSCYTIVIH